ncbi:class I SAM-dependent methyltransferase [Patulibacter sp. NPDC049589]|uniref:class I SAM-dependent methyltransferase n=1 Tax=Patulibacter sp. NPDC049589 TaxID=3154731 RepID=UPI0034228993
MSAPEDPELRRIARFWDARAKEDARRYSTPGGVRVDDETFNAAGEAVLHALEHDLGWFADGAARALDLGCGVGRLTRALAGRADEVLAVDISPRMLEVAQARLRDVENVTWHTADAGDLPRLPPATIDAALAIGVLTHLPTAKHVAAAIDELGRLLRPGGIAAFDVRSGPQPLALPGEDDLPVHVIGHPLWHGAAIDLETLAALAHQADLIVERIEGSGSARCLVLVRRDDV